MAYDLMLLADPGPERAKVLEVLAGTPHVRPDPQVENRFWLRTDEGRAQINIGTKDPVESVHLELESVSPALMQAVAARALDLADSLGMRLEDVQWGDEVTRATLPRLVEHWQSATPPATAGAQPAGRPWWRFW